MRDEHSIIIPTALTLPEFDYLKELKWECTEKIDGTNIHCDVYYDGVGEVQIEICGRTQKAIIPTHLLARLNEIFTVERITGVFKQQLETITKIKTCDFVKYRAKYGTDAEVEQVVNRHMDCYARCEQRIPK